MKQRRYEDPKGCDRCHDGYVVYLAVKTDRGSEYLCSACHQKIFGTTGGYPTPKEDR